MSVSGVPYSTVRPGICVATVVTVAMTVGADLFLWLFALRFLNLLARLGVRVLTVAFVLVAAVLDSLLRLVLLDAMRSVTFAIFAPAVRLSGQCCRRDQHGCDTEHRCNLPHGPLLFWVNEPKTLGRLKRFTWEGGFFLAREGERVMAMSSCPFGTRPESKASSVNAVSLRIVGVAAGWALLGVVEQVNEFTGVFGRKKYSRF
jgi:hypothetical protein